MRECSGLFRPAAKAFVAALVLFHFIDFSGSHFIGKGKKPETHGVTMFYDEFQARKYSTSSRMMYIQREMTTRAIELLEIENLNSTIMLDLGCGSGLSGSVLSDFGIQWVGLDISSAMLEQAKKREVKGDIMLADMSKGLPFRRGSFDAVIGISCLQWLFVSDSNQFVSDILSKFFHALKICLTAEGRAVFQFYPADPKQSEMLTSAARKAGFKGGVMIDEPEVKKRAKHFLCLSLGPKQSFMRKADADKWAKRRELTLKSKRQLKQSEKIVRKRHSLRENDGDRKKRSRYSGKHRSKKFEVR